MFKDEEIRSEIQMSTGKINCNCSNKAGCIPKAMIREREESDIDENRLIYSTETKQRRRILCKK